MYAGTGGRATLTLITRGDLVSHLVEDRC